MATILPKSDMALPMRKALFSLLIFDSQCYYGWPRMSKDFISFAIFLHIESPSQTVFLSLDLFNLKISRLTAL